MIISSTIAFTSPAAQAPSRTKTTRIAPRGTVCVLCVCGGVKDNK